MGAGKHAVVITPPHATTNTLVSSPTTPIPPNPPQTIRGLTGCIAFLSEEPPRQRAYRCLPQVVALLTHEARHVWTNVWVVVLGMDSSVTDMHETNMPSTQQVQDPRDGPPQGPQPRGLRAARLPGP